MKRLLASITICLFFLSHRLPGQTVSEEYVKVVLLQKIAENLKWPLSEEIDSYQFHFISANENLIDPANALSQTFTVHGKPIAVTFGDGRDIPNNTHLIYIEGGNPNKVKTTYESIRDKAILLVSNEYTNSNGTMINFFVTKNKKVRFSINRKNILAQGIEIDPEILLLIGNDLDVVQLYKETQDSLNLREDQYGVLAYEYDSLQKAIGVLAYEYDSLQKAIKEFKVLVETQARQFRSQQIAINSQQNAIKKYQSTVSNLEDEITLKQQALSDILPSLKDKEKALKTLENEMDVRNQFLDKQAKIINETREKIKSGEAKLDELSAKLGIQQNALLILLIFIALMIVIVALIFMSYKNKKKSNYKLENLNAEIQKSNHSLSVLNEEKDRIIRILAHDLKNPVSNIISCIELVNEEKHSKQTTELLRFVEQSSFKMKQMITNILSVETAKKNLSNLELTLVNFSAAIDESIAHFEKQAEKKNIQLIKGIPLDIWIKVNPTHLSQIIDNLLSNAIKFSDHKKNIYIELFSKNKTATLKVQDEGPGLTEEDKTKLFEEFEELSAKPTGGENSTGLGLFIVKKFAEAMNGIISCESQLGEGASFFVSFPVVQKME